MLISGYINGKDVRICLECRKGMMLADIISNKTQTMYCINCGTKHTYRRTKKGSVEINKLDEKCSEKKMKEILYENEETFMTFVKLLVKEYKLTKEELFDYCNKAEKEEAELNG